ncbi:MAG: hypothetical protein AB9819_04305 [Methanomassiliicoccales archaeon]
MGKLLDDLELYLGEDVLQGEDAIPFYLLWKDDDIENITLKFDGFNKIVQLFNVDSEDVITEIPISKIKINGYLGGTLVPSITNNPFLSGSLTIIVRYKNGMLREIKEERTIHTTRVENVVTPDEIWLPSKHAIQINLLGHSTILIEIRECEKSEVKLDYPDDVKNAFSQISKIFSDNMNDLLEKFPNHSDFIDLLINPPSNVSINELKEQINTITKKVIQDKEFTDALISTWISIITIQMSNGNPIFYSILEYFESRAGNKAFLNNPLLCVNVPKGGGKLCFEFIMKDILGNECGDPVEVNVKLQANKEFLYPIKDLITICRKDGV